MLIRRKVLKADCSRACPINRALENRLDNWNKLQLFPYTHTFNYHSMYKTSNETQELILRSQLMKSESRISGANPTSYNASAVKIYNVSAVNI
jgi:hypothetical protein